MHWPRPRPKRWGSRAEANSEGRGTAERDFAVSVAVVPAYRGFGAGLDLLRCAENFVESTSPKSNIYANIKQGNKASQGLFSAAGFMRGTQGPTELWYWMVGLNKEEKE